MFPPFPLLPHPDAHVLLTIPPRLPARLGLDLKHDCATSLIFFRGGTRESCARCRLKHRHAGNEGLSCRNRREMPGSAVRVCGFPVMVKMLFSTHSWLNPWMCSLGIRKADCIVIENDLCVNGPVQFKPMLFKDQLCLHLCYHNCS